MLTNYCCFYLIPPTETPAPTDFHVRPPTGFSSQDRSVGRYREVNAKSNKLTKLNTETSFTSARRLSKETIRKVSSQSKYSTTSISTRGDVVPPKPQATVQSHTRTVKVVGVTKRPKTKAALETFPSADSVTATGKRVSASGDDVEDQSDTKCSSSTSGTRSTSGTQKETKTSRYGLRKMRKGKDSKTFLTTDK